MEEFLGEKRRFSEKSKSLLQSAFVYSGLCLVVLLFILLLANVGQAASLERQLEKAALDPNTTNLYVVEKNAADLLQENKGSGYLHYILSIIAARQFSEDPAAMPLLKQATELAQQAIDLAPTKDYGYVALANLLDLVGQTDKAIEVMEIAQKSVKDLTWRFKFLNAKLLVDRSPFSSVINELRSALTDKDAIQEAIVPSVISIVSVSFKDFELVEALESFNLAAHSPYFELAIAQEYARLGLYKKSVDLLAKVEKESPDIVEAKINRAVITYRYLGQNEKAEVMFKKILESKNLPALHQSLVNVHYAAALMRSKNFRKAGEYFANGVAVASDLEATLAFIAREYKDQSAPRAEYLKVLLSLTEITPGVALIHGLIGETLYDMGSTNDENSVEEFTNAIVLDSKKPEYFVGRGLSMFRMKEFSTALVDFKFATKLDPNDASAHYNLACAYSKLGQQDEASVALEQAFELDPKLIKNALKDTDLASVRDMKSFDEIVQRVSQKTAH